MSRRSRLLPEERSSVLELRRRHGLTFAELAELTGVRAATLRVWARRERAARSVPRFGVLDIVGRGGDARVAVDRAELTLLLAGIDRKSARFRKDFPRRVSIQARTGNESAGRAID